MKIRVCYLMCITYKKLHLCEHCHHLMYHSLNSFPLAIKQGVQCIPKMDILLKLKNKLIRRGVVVIYCYYT